MVARCGGPPPIFLINLLFPIQAKRNDILQMRNEGLMKRLIVGNWKMNLNPGEASLLVKRLEQKLPPHPDTEVVVCPPFIDLQPVAKEADPKLLKVGAQNLHWADEGPYTGEIGAAMLRGL